VESRDWRVELSLHYRHPTLKLSYAEAVANRLKRVYLALLGVLLVAWVFRISSVTPRQNWLPAAGICRLPGSIVVAVVGMFHVALLTVAFWPRERHAKGEFREEDTDDWKESDQ